MTLGIGITSYNDYVMTNYLLNSIFFFTKKDEICEQGNRIIVIDDGSDNDYREKLKNVCSAYGVDLICNDSNLGVPRSWNKLVKELGTDLVILLNNDLVVWKGWFEAIRYGLEKNPEIGTVSLPTLIINKCDMGKVVEKYGSGGGGVCGGCGGSGRDERRCVEILKPSNKMIRNGCFGLPETRDPVRVLNPIGCSFGFSRKMYDKALGFNEIYKYFYEEVDFGISLHGMKHGNIVLPGPHIYHVWGATFADNYSGVGEKRIDAQGVMSESRKKFIEKYGHDQTEMFRLLDHNFDTKVKYLGWNGNGGDGTGNWVEKEVILRETYSPDCGIEW